MNPNLSVPRNNFNNTNTLYSIDVDSEDILPFDNRIKTQQTHYSVIYIVEDKIKMTKTIKIPENLTKG